MPHSPISISIPPQLQRHNISLSGFLEKHQSYDTLAVGAFIFSPSRLSSPPIPRLLLIQRAATERSFPNLWEIPGGGSEPGDPTILHSVAREVFEEVGLHLTRFVRHVGKGEEFKVGSKNEPKRCLKLSFEIEVLEIGNRLLAELPPLSHSHALEHGDSREGAELWGFGPQSLEAVNVVVDPEEHQAFRWTREEDLAQATVVLNSGDTDFEKRKETSAGTDGVLNLVSENQRELMLAAFALHKTDLQSICTGTTVVTTVLSKST
ncbi:hypothetical protein MMC11_009139 [Xylographa trunciseda]|nr:hypothetical protein [Xylographa trunciseda]